MCSSAKNRSSRLLSLPQELKDHIYGFVYSGHIIQVEQEEDLRRYRDAIEAEEDGNVGLKDPDAKMRHYVCECLTTKQYAVNQDPRAIFRDFLRVEYLSKNVSYEGCSHRKKLDVSLLQTCQQILQEARRILYLSNTFSFKNPHTLHVFGERSSNADKLNIRSLRLGMNFPKGTDKMLFDKKMGRLSLDEIEWSEAICLTVVDRLERLQNVELYIVQGTNHFGVKQAEWDRLSPARSKDWISFILELRNLPLKSAKLLVRDWDYLFAPKVFDVRSSLGPGVNKSKLRRWSPSFQDQWADNARSVILRHTKDPDNRAVVSHSLYLFRITQLNIPRRGRESFDPRLHMLWSIGELSLDLEAGGSHGAPLWLVCDCV